jgi:ATP-dependent DNA ligase
VAKKADSPYRPDDGTTKNRRREWVKVKHYIRHGRDEKVIRGVFRR